MNKYHLILLFLVSLISCRKERDEDYPSVSFQSPGVNTSHQVLEPIPFKVTASDETHLEKITVQLLNDSYLPVANSSTLFCDENSEIFEGSILTEDIHLPSGTYFLKAKAFDGFNEKVAYREIQLIEVPKQLMKVWVVTATGTSSVHLDSLSNGNLLNAHNISQDFGGFITNSYNRLMIIAGKNNGDLKVLDGEYPTDKFSWTNTGTGSEPFFTFLYNENDLTFIADRSGIIRSFRKTSTVIDVVDLGNYFSESFCLVNDHLVTASVLSSGSQRSIQVYFLSSSTLLQGVISTTEVKKIFSLDGNEFIFFGNESGVGKIKTYSLSDNIITEPFSFSGGEIYDVTEISNGNYLIAHSNGFDYYESSSLTLTNLITGNPYQLMRYDELSQTIYAAHGNQLETYALSPLNLIQNYVASDSIQGLDLLYNK